MKNTPNIILDEERLRSIVESLKIKQEDKERIHTFITVLALIAKASFIKSTAKELLKGK
jgi:hypothetical protein